jgi:hypothetical protein
MATNFGPSGASLFFIRGSMVWKSMSGPSVLTSMCARIWSSGVSLAGPMYSPIPGSTKKRGPEGGGMSKREKNKGGNGSGDGDGTHRHWQ